MKLTNLREEIDIIDNKLITLLKERTNLAKQIAQIKKQSNLPIEDKEREQQIMNKLTTELEKEIFHVILKHSKDAQNNSLQK